jgi:high-affinity K+ transport system ATPase subunit B
VPSSDHWSLATGSIANEVAKYFAIIPAMLIALFGELQAVNIMQLATPKSAILSALAFSAIIIPMLIPLALRVGSSLSWPRGSASCGPLQSLLGLPA